MQGSQRGARVAAAPSGGGSAPAPAGPVHGLGGAPITLSCLGGGGGRLLHLPGSGRRQPQAAGLPWAARSAL